MNVMTALYQTYLNCEQAGLVDKVEDLDSNESPVLLPIFHTNKRASSASPIIEVLLNEQSQFIRSRYLDENTVVIFPITEDSISRTSKAEPHALSDEFSYLSPQIDRAKFDLYLENLEKWVEYNQSQSVISILDIIFNYVQKGQLLENVLDSLFQVKEFSVSKDKVNFLRDNKNQSISSKVFITFRIQTDAGADKSVSNDRALHQNYINYVDHQLSLQPQGVCKVSGDKMYITSKHRGLMGNAKLISVSNHKETYYGRFKDGEDIIQIGYITSQKALNMIKYLMEYRKTAAKLDSSTFVLTWPAVGITEFDYKLTAEQDFLDEEDDFDFLDNLFEEDVDRYKLRPIIAQKINKRIGGWAEQTHNNVGDISENFFVLIVDKVSNGRISVKYFRNLTLKDFYERVNNWYLHTYWTYGYGKFQSVKTPSLSHFANYTFGIYEKEKNYVDLRNEKLKKTLFEKLIPSIVDGKYISLDIVNKSLMNMTKREAFGNSWNTVVSTSCSVLKKYKWDYYREDVYEELDKNKLDRDYLYGRLLAVFEVIEVNGSGDYSKVTNVEKYWSSFVNSPENYLNRLRESINPYLARIKKDPKGNYIRFDKLLTEIISKIDELEVPEETKNKRLNENFVFGYYSQKKSIYAKNEKSEEQQ